MPRLGAWLLGVGATVAAAGISRADPAVPPPAASHADPAPRARPVAPPADPDLRLPPGTRTDAHGQLVSGRGIRETSDFLARDLARRGLRVAQIGPYGAHGAVITRFVSQTPSTPWRALHVLRVGGKTVIFFVPRAKSAATP